MMTMDAQCDTIEDIRRRYDEARCGGGNGQRLFYAMKIAAMTDLPDDRGAFADECLENLMPQRAEAEIAAVLEMEPENVRALEGMGRCLAMKASRSPGLPVCIFPVDT